MQNYSSQFPEYEPNTKQNLVLHMSFIGLYKKKQLYFDIVAGLV